MKQRLLTNWTFQRAVYVILGALILTQSIISRQWFGIALGGYFTAMGLFAFGCAAGNCSVQIPRKSSDTPSGK